MSVMRSWMHSWAWPEGHGKSTRIMAGADARLKAAAACLAEQWCAAVHEALWPGGLALCLPSWCVGWLLLLDMSGSVLLLTDNLLFGLASFYFDFCRFVWSVIGGLVELVGMACWMSSHGCGPEKGCLHIHGSMHHQS
jgi:hypothetical protein